MGLWARVQVQSPCAGLYLGVDIASLLSGVYYPLEAASEGGDKFVVCLTVCHAEHGLRHTAHSEPPRSADESELRSSPSRSGSRKAHRGALWSVVMEILLHRGL